MKILMVNKFLYPNGGSETYIFKLGKQLESLGHQVQYFGMEHEGRCVGNHAQQYTANMDFHGGSMLSKITYPVKTVYSAEAKRKMTVVLNDFQPDIIHINNFNYQLTPSIIYAADSYKKRAGKRVKIVFTAHDYQLVCPNHMMFDINGNVCEDCVTKGYASCIKKRCIHGSRAKSIIGATEASLYKALKTYKMIDSVICCSEFLKSKMDTNPVFASKTIALHNFIESITDDNTEKDDYVLYFGRYDKEKGIELIMKAKDISFICAGSGELEKEINKQPHIKNVGFKSGDELKSLIQRAKCSVYPSVWYENCPFSVMESIMYGTPVVGSRIGGIPELIEDGKTGILFEAGNTEAMENAINKILLNDDLAKEMSVNCKNAKFNTVSEYTEKLLKIYNS